MPVTKAFGKAPLLYVEWLDSNGGAAWAHASEIPDKLHCEPCRTVGWLLDESDTMILLAACIGGHPDRGSMPPQFCCDIAIPKVAIKKRRRIKFSC